MVFKKIGKFKFETFFSQLESDRERAYAKVWGMRGSYKPLSFIELGATRSIVYEGEGRPHYHRLKDYWKIFKANKENPKDGNDYYDNDQKASLDFTIYLPFLKNIKGQPFKGGKMYYVYAGEDRHKHSLPPLATVAHIYGLKLTTGKTDILCEYADTIDDASLWYTHHYYPQGYTYKEFLIGHHMGGDAEDIFFEIFHDFEKFRGAFAMDYEKREKKFSKIVEKRREVLIRGDIPVNLKKFMKLTPISSTVSMEFHRSSWKNFNHVQGKEKKDYWLSIGLNLKF